MPCPNNQQNRREVIVCDTLFKYDLTETTDTAYELVVTPCCNPTAVYDIARITRRENACSGLAYYQAAINTDPVQIIQDCDSENTIRRCIIEYFNDLPCINCSNECGCCRNTRNNNNWLF